MIEEAITKYSDMIYRLALIRIGNIHDAQDIMQEVFLKLVKYYNRGKAFNDEEHRKAWLIRVTVNAGKNLTLSASKRKNISLTEVAENAKSTDESETEKLEKQLAVYSAVMDLDEKYKVVVHLFYYEDMKVEQICKATGLSESTVKTRLHRARKMLEETLRGGGFHE